MPLPRKPSSYGGEWRSADTSRGSRIRKRTVIPLDTTGTRDVRSLSEVLDGEIRLLLPDQLAVLHPILNENLQNNPQRRVNGDGRWGCIQTVGTLYGGYPTIPDAQTVLQSRIIVLQP
jgi:hypothetical protein